MLCYHTEKLWQLKEGAEGGGRERRERKQIVSLSAESKGQDRERQRR